MLAKQRPAHGGILSILVALPHGDAWAFGEHGQFAPYNGYPLAEYWNGKVLSAAVLPKTQRCGPIAAAGASSASNVWAVGINGCALRLSGGIWKVAKDWTGGQLTGITVLGPSNVWVFGGTGLPAGMPGVGTWHYNGRAWQRVRGIGGDVQTASVVSASDIWAIGITADGKVTKFLEHYNGHSWQRIAGVSQPYGVLAVGKDIWVTAGSGPIGELERLTKAGRWLKVPVPDKYSPVLASADGAGGIWLTSERFSKSSTQNEVLHLSSAGKWTITQLTAGDVELELSRIPGTATSVLALGLLKTDAALFGYGKF